MTPDQLETLTQIFHALDDAGAELLQDKMNTVLGIRDAREAVNNARNTINGILQREN